MGTITSVNAYIGRELQRIKDNIELRSADEREQRRRRKNVEEFLNFTSNLISLLGNSKVTLQGSRKNNSPIQKFKSSVKDYKGSIAGDIFGAKFSTNGMGNRKGFNI